MAFILPERKDPRLGKEGEIRKLSLDRGDRRSHLGYNKGGAERHLGSR
jgi:hypothetical protein